MTIKVVVFTAAFDTGGQGYRIKAAFDRYQPDFSVRSIHTFETYFEYPSDLRYMAGATNTYGLTEAADVIHFRNSFGGLKRLRASGKPVGLVLHHHGTMFREEHVQIAAEARDKGAIQLASTLDLVLLEPDVEWLPSPFDLLELQALRHEALACKAQSHARYGEKCPKTIRIAHSPTNRTVKSTNMVISAVQTLAKQGLDVSLDLIERKSYAETLRRKAKADILVDQLHLGYGNSAVEAWGMGIPVIAGISDSYVRSKMEERWHGLPFLEASESTLAERLAEMATDPELRARWGEIGLTHAYSYHGDCNVSNLLAEYYRRSIAATAVTTEKVV
jgi:hypothetical protein